MWMLTLNCSRMGVVPASCSSAVPYPLLVLMCALTHSHLSLLSTFPWDTSAPGEEEQRERGLTEVMFGPHAALTSPAGNGAPRACSALSGGTLADAHPPTLPPPVGAWQQRRGFGNWATGYGVGVFSVEALPSPCCPGGLWGSKSSHIYECDPPLLSTLPSS